MPRFTLCALALALFVVVPAWGAPTPSRDDVLAAIRTFEVNASGAAGAGASEAVAKASNTILKFSLESDAVVVDLGTDAVTWCDVKKGLADLPNSGERGLLLAAYLSGSVRTQLDSGKQDANPLPGWTAMLRVYRNLKMREGIRIPEAEALLARQAAGSLEAYAAEAAKRSHDHLRREYGEPDAPTQVLTASARP